jgi:hypothetical protein
MAQASEADNVKSRWPTTTAVFDNG